MDVKLKCILSCTDRRGIWNVEAAEKYWNMEYKLFKYFDYSFVYTSLFIRNLQQEVAFASIMMFIANVESWVIYQNYELWIRRFYLYYINSVMLGSCWLLNHFIMFCFTGLFVKSFNSGFSLYSAFGACKCRERTQVELFADLDFCFCIDPIIPFSCLDM